MRLIRLELSDLVYSARAQSIQPVRSTIPDMADDLLRYRSQFPILERTTYLISNSLGAMPQGVYDARE